MIAEVDFVFEHLCNIEKDLKELILMITEKYDIECESADKVKKVFDRNFNFYSEK